MGGGVSRPASEPPKLPSKVSKEPSKQSTGSTRSAVSVREPKVVTTIDGRIQKTLRELNITRRSAQAKVKTMNFERIVLRFAMARDAFEMIHSIYYQYADEDKGLDFDGLKAVLQALGAEMNECDMREIFYESDMVRDNSLSHNEFVISLAISYLLGLIANFENISRVFGQTPEEGESPAHDASPEDVIPSPRDGLITENSPVIIAKTLELIVTAYLLFDEDASGTIQIGEVRKVMQKHNESSNRKILERKSSGTMTKAIRAERIKELDLNRDGTITFQEFVLTFQNWVGVDDA